MAKKEEELVTQSDELVEQTFGGGFDSDITVTRESEGVTATDGGESYVGTVSKTKITSKKSSNVIIFGVVGVVAAGIIGYKLFMDDKSVEQAQITQPINMVATKEEQLPVVEQPQITTVVEVPNINAPSGSITGVMAPEVEVKVKPAPVAEVKTTEVKTTEVETTPVSEVKTTEVKTTEVKTTPVVEIKRVVSGSLEERVVRHEDMIVAQDKKMNMLLERMGNLEAKVISFMDSIGNGTQLKKQNTEIVTSYNDVNVVKAKPKQKKSKIKAKHKDVLFDKSMVANNKSEGNEVNGYSIYSMYSGRFWIKNPDGTLSSFSVGDRMPNGEMVKRVDMDAKSIKTDKGFIRVE